jgi:hypothetical protein
MKDRSGNIITAGGTLDVGLHHNAVGTFYPRGLSIENWKFSRSAHVAFLFTTACGVTLFSPMKVNVSNGPKQGQVEVDRHRRTTTVNKRLTVDLTRFFVKICHVDVL